MVLFVNACVRSASRTKRLADAYLRNLKDEITEVYLANKQFPNTQESYLEMRDQCTKNRDFSSSIFQIAKEFAAADEIVIAAPFWDLSFPAILKQYLERVTVPGLTFYYTPEGIPKGLCRAQKLTYITTAGGPILCEEYGYGYLRALATQLYGIPCVQQIKAEGLDLDGADVEAILRYAMEKSKGSM